jgi:hypothetical protein
MLVRGVLQSHQGLRGSGLDLKYFFFQLAERETSLARNAVGRQARGEEALHPGGAEGNVYRQVVQVAGMGKPNAPDIATQVHLNVQKQVGNCSDSTRLEYGHPLPTGELMEGVYIDDYNAMEIVNMSIFD